MYRLLLKDCIKSAIKVNPQSHSRTYSKHDLPRQAGFGKLLLMIAPFAATTGVVAYAKYDNEFRKMLIQNVPGSEPVLKFLLQEETSFKNLKLQIENLTSSVNTFFGGSSDRKHDDLATFKLDRSPKTDSLENLDKISLGPTRLKIPNISEAKPVQISKNDESIPTDLSELEKAIEISASLAVEEYNKAVKVLKAYNEDVRKVVDEAVDRIDLTSWNILKNKTGARNTAVENAEKTARAAVDKIEKYEHALSTVVNSIDQVKLDAIRMKIATLNQHINGAKEELYKNKDNSSLSERYWKKVESARNYYVNEIESIFPSLNLSEKKIDLSKEDLDLFLIHAYSHVLAYQKELQRLQVEGELRLKRAIDAIRGTDETDAVQTQLDFHLEKEKRTLALENQKKIFKIRNEIEKEMRQQLKRQSEAHVDHLQDALAQKEAELKRGFSRELDEKLSSEKASYKIQLASMVGKLRGMDAALKARADSEKCAHQAQALWAACQALWASVRTGEPGVHWSEKLRPLKSELRAVDRAAAEGDELVTIVLQNLPKEVAERGVYPEDALKERFFNVEKLARKVALVPEEGASVPVYILSYIQYLLIMGQTNVVTEDELQNEMFDFSKLDTYDIISRARYYIDRGDLTLCLKYMNLLQGAPRKISNDWMKEARILLETQQAANTLMAHAAASGLLYL